MRRQKVSNAIETPENVFSEKKRASSRPSFPKTCASSYSKIHLQEFDSNRSDVLKTLQYDFRKMKHSENPKDNLNLLNFKNSGACAEIPRFSPRSSRKISHQPETHSKSYLKLMLEIDQSNPRPSTTT
eukprot:GDKJ01032016.1.p1 GENE.GDKJ01032016.1~~GDKJ01032016.1.p1  ORF type:complete len:128 (-),score=16.53 GDKJ01032016.1:8-391(-)